MSSPATLGGVEGRLKIRLIRNGEVVYEEESGNSFTDAGLDFVAKVITGLQTGTVTHMAIGNGNATTPGSCPAFSGTLTALGNELARVAVTASYVATGQVDLTASFTPPTGTTWSSTCEAGLFDASTGGTLVAYANIGPYTLDSNTTLSITWSLTFTRV